MTTFDRSSPVFYVSAVPDGSGGRTIRVDDFSDRVLSFKYEDEEQKADRLTITLDNWDLALYDDPAFKHGMLLDVTWGYPGRMVPPRRCVVQSIKGGRVVTVTALAQSILLNKITRVRTFTNARVSDVVRQIATDAGFGSDVLDIEETPVARETITQARLTDAQFVRKLADREGFEFYVDHEGFHFHRRRVGQAPIRVLTYFIDQEGGDILDFGLDDDITKPKGRHRRKGRNLLERTEIDEEASNESDTDRTSLAPITPTIAPRENGPTLNVCFDRDTSAAAATSTSSVDDRVASEDVAPTSAQDATTARREAVGRNRRDRQSAIKMKIKVIGDPYIAAKTVIDVRGLGARLSGRYYVTRATTVIGADYSLDLDVISDGHGGHARTSRVARDLELPSEQRNAGTPGPAGGADPDALEAVVTFDRDTSAMHSTYRPRTQTRGGS